jgi:hypothetical protein
MKCVNRTALALITATVLAIAIGVIGTELGLGSWGFTAVALVALLLVTLLDREGFYGTARRHHAPRS